MMFDAAEYDRACIERAREFAAMRTLDDVRAHYAAKYPEGHMSHDLFQASPLGGFLGGAAESLKDLLAIIGRQADVIARLTAQDDEPEDDGPLTGVPMVCTACRKPVSEAEDNAGRRMWLHDFPGDGGACPRLHGPVMAMVAAGNEHIPFDLARPASSVQLDG